MLLFMWVGMRLAIALTIPQAPDPDPRTWHLLRFWEAILWYSTAVFVCPTDAVLYSNRSVSFQKLALYDEAVRDAVTCIALKPDWAKGHFRLATAYKEMGRVAEAKRVVKDAKKLAPDDEAIAMLVRQLKKMG